MNIVHSPEAIPDAATTPRTSRVTSTKPRPVVEMDSVFWICFRCALPLLAMSGERSGHVLSAS
jgi:hypothetical protein